MVLKEKLSFVDWVETHHAPQAYYDRLWAKMSVGLRAQAARRAARAQAKDIEINSVRAAGSFKQFQHQLKRGNGRLFAETVKMKAYHLEQVKALPQTTSAVADEVKALPSAARLALPFPWHFVQLGLYRMQAKENLAEQDNQLEAAIKVHCSHVQLKARMAEHNQRILLEYEKYMDRICARQARRDGWREDRSSSFRLTDIGNPFKWIEAFIRG